MESKKTFYQAEKGKVWSYLDDGKKELDDESINKNVLQTLLNRNTQYTRILDAGCGTGTQIRRFIELGLLKNNGEIIGIDINKDGLLTAIAPFMYWCKTNGYSFEKIDEDNTINTFSLKKKDNNYVVRLYEESVYNLGTSKSKIAGNFPLVTALSLLEHTDIDKALSGLSRVLEDNGILYLPVNYDQFTHFGPTIDDINEAKLMSLFNYKCIDNQNKGGVEVGNSHCGTILPLKCKERGLKLLDYGSSNWEIYENMIIPYSTNKKKMLEFLVNAFYNELASTDDSLKKMFGITKNQIQKWHSERLNQLANGKLAFTCLNKDVLCQKK